MVTLKNNGFADGVFIADENDTEKIDRMRDLCAEIFVTTDFEMSAHVLLKLH